MTKEQPMLPARGDAAGAAVNLAMSAAAYAAPAQRDRIIQEAAAKAFADRVAQSEAAAHAHDAPPAAPQGPRAPATYTPPSWSGVPEGVAYGLEVTKNGTIIEEHRIADKAYYTFGRTPNNDFILEHPSASRLHAVLQYKSPDHTAYLYDANSTHGVLINKKRIPPGEYTPLHVGDVVRFGQSSRLYLLTGPPELMPEEGPSLEQRRQAKAAAVAASRRKQEAAVAEEQMAQALRGEVTWGMAEDAVEEVDEYGDIDWRAYRDRNGLSEKQSKIAQKIEGRAQRISHLQRELDKIKSKHAALEDLTPGQLDMLVRHGQDIDRLTIEIEDMEEGLCDSIRDAMRNKQQQQEGGGTGGKRAGGGGKGRSRKRGSDDDDDAGPSDDDTFYDRSKQGSTRRLKKSKQGGPHMGEVLDAATLLGKVQVLEAEIKTVQAALDVEVAKAPPSTTSQSTSDKSQSMKAEGMEDAEEDALDAYMASMNQQLEHDKAATLRKDLDALQQQLQEAQKLLRIADPEGYFTPGSAAAKAAAAKAKQHLQQERQRKAAEAQRRKREAAAAAAQEQQTKLKAAGGDFIPEEEEEEEEEGVRDAAGTKEQQQHTSAQQQATTTPAGDEDVHMLPSSSASQQQGGLVVRKPPISTTAQRDDDALPGMRKPSREEVQRRLAAAKHVHTDGAKTNPSQSAEEAAKAKVIADLALLSGAAQRQAEEEEEQAPVTKISKKKSTKEDWQPPSGQTGDGRTKLNDLLGY